MLLQIIPKLEATVIGCVVVGIIIFFVYLIYMKSLDMMADEIKRGLISSVSAAATTIDGDLHGTFNEKTDRQDPIYLKTIKPLEAIRQASTGVRYLYTNIKVGDKVYFILNPSPQNDNDKDGKADLAPALMDEYIDPANALLIALTELKVTVTQEPYIDEWGTFISAYAPIKDSNGKVVGTLGMDYELNGFYARLKPLGMLFEKAIVIVIFLGIIVGMLFFISRKHSLFLIANVQEASEKLTLLYSRLDKRTEENYHILKMVKADFQYNNKQKRWLEDAIDYLESQKDNIEEVISNFNINDLLANIESQLSSYQLKIEPFENIELNEVSGYLNEITNTISLIIKLIFKLSNAKNALITVNVLDEGINDVSIAINCSVQIDFEHELLFNPLPASEVLQMDYDANGASCPLTLQAIVINRLHRINALINPLKQQAGVQILLKLNKCQVQDT